MGRLDSRLGYTEEGAKRLIEQVHQFMKSDRSARDPDATDMR